MGRFNAAQAAIAVAVGLAASASVAASGWVAQNASLDAAFWMLAACPVVGLIYFGRVVPETKERALDAH